MGTYNQKRFRKVLQTTGVSKPIKKDNCDLLVYLLYVNYMNELVKKASSAQTGGPGDDGELTKFRLDKAHQELMRRHRG